jgi:hypothetical protein
LQSTTLKNIRFYSERFETNLTDLPIPQVVNASLG